MTAPTPAGVIPRNHPVRRLLARLFATLLLGVVVGLALPTPPAAHAALSGTPKDCAKAPVDMMATACPTVTPAPAPAPSPTEPTDEKAKAAGSADQGTQFGQDEEPTGWAGPIAKDLGQGTQGLAGDLSEKLAKDGLLPDFKFSKGYLTLYAVMFGLGQIIAAAATMIATVKLAERGVESRLLFRQAMIRLLTFTPVAALTPLLVAYVSQLGEGLAQGFLSMAADQLRAQLTWLVKALAVGTLAGIVVPGGSAVMAGLFLFLIASLVGVLLELAISHYLVFLLTLLIPILYAASINPKWRGGVTKVTGGLLGAVLAPAALFLVWVVAFSAVPRASSDGFFMRAGMLIVGLLLSLAAPMAIGMVLSYVVPAFTGGRYDGATLSGLAERASSKVTQSGGGQGSRSSRSQRASEVTDNAEPGPPVERPSKGGVPGTAPGGPPAITAGPSSGPAAITAGGGAGGPAAGGAAAGSTAGAAGAGAVAGPVGAAASVWMGIVNKVRAGAEQVRDSVSGRAVAGDEEHRGGGEPTDEPPIGGGNASEGGKPWKRAGETPDAARDVGGVPATTRNGGESRDAARRPEGAPDTAPKAGGAADATRTGGEGPVARNSGEGRDTARDVGAVPATARNGGEGRDAARRPEGAPDTALKAGGAADATRTGGEAPDTARRPEGAAQGRAERTDSGGKPGTGGGSEGGLGLVSSGPGFTPAPGDGRPRRSRPDDRGEVV